MSVTATLNNDDEEGDGLLDDYENNGFRDGFGNRHITETNLVDTDGDGLSDGYETEYPITDENGRTYFKQRSDPTKADTDDDGLDDFWEDYLGTDPYDPDTDHDFVRDGDDDDPLIPAYNTAINDAIRNQVALRLGTIFGETGLRGEICYELIGGDTYSSTPPYVSGWIISGIAVYGDVRDFIYAVSEYDTYGAALTGIGLIPLVGDAEKVGADVVKYIEKYPKAIKPLGRHLAAQGIIGFFPADKQLRIIDDFFPVGDDGVKVGTRLITEYDDLVVDDLVMLMRRGVDLTEVVHVTKVGDGAIPFIEESLDHAVGRHVDGTEDVLKKSTTLFPTSDPVVWYSKTGLPLQYPGTSTMTREEMKEKLIQWTDEALEATQSGWATQSKKPTYSPPDAHQYGIDEITVGLNPKTGVATVFPTKGSQVFKWYNDKWNPIV